MAARDSDPDHPFIVGVWRVPLIDAGHRVDQWNARSEEHTSELQSRFDLVCRLLLEKKNTEPPDDNSRLEHRNTVHHIQISELRSAQLCLRVVANQLCTQAPYTSPLQSPQRNTNANT